MPGEPRPAASTSSRAASSGGGPPARRRSPPPRPQHRSWPGWRAERRRHRGHRCRAPAHASPAPAAAGAPPDSQPRQGHRQPACRLVCPEFHHPEVGQRLQRRRQARRLVLLGMTAGVGRVEAMGVGTRGRHECLEQGVHLHRPPHRVEGRRHPVQVLGAEHHGEGVVPDREHLLGITRGKHVHPVGGSRPASGDLEHSGAGRDPPGRIEFARRQFERPHGSCCLAGRKPAFPGQIPPLPHPAGDLPGGSQQRRDPRRPSQLLPGGQAHRRQPGRLAVRRTAAVPRARGRSRRVFSLPAASAGSHRSGGRGFRRAAQGLCRVAGAGSPGIPLRVRGFRREVATPAPYGLQRGTQIRSAGSSCTRTGRRPCGHCARPGRRAKLPPAPSPPIGARE